jgi:nucleotide-binding universal stress UspA family protein
MNGILEQVAPNEAILGARDFSVERIVVAVDLFEHSKKTASYAIALAKSFGASITFVHVFPHETIRERATEDIHKRYERGRDIAKERLATFGDRMSQIYHRCETEFRIGDTAEQVQLAALNVKADLIITASYHPGFLGHLLGLEQARRIMTDAPCAVLVLHQLQE